MMLIALLASAILVWLAPPWTFDVAAGAMGVLRCPPRAGSPLRSTPRPSPAPCASPPRAATGTERPEPRRAAQRAVLPPEHGEHGELLLEVRTGP